MYKSICINTPEINNPFFFQNTLELEETSEAVCNMKNHIINHIAELLHQHLGNCPQVVLLELCDPYLPEMFRLCNNPHLLNTWHSTCQSRDSWSRAPTRAHVARECTCGCCATRSECHVITPVRSDVEASRGESDRAKERHCQMEGLRVRKF